MSGETRMLLEREFWLRERDFLSCERGEFILEGKMVLVGEYDMQQEDEVRLKEWPRASSFVCCFSLSQSTIQVVMRNEARKICASFAFLNFPRECVAPNRKVSRDSLASSFRIWPRSL